MEMFQEAETSVKFEGKCQNGLMSSVLSPLFFCNCLRCFIKWFGKDNEEFLYADNLVIMGDC